MNISGILVVVAPDKIESMITTLESLPGVDVHHVDRPTGRIVITQEAESIHEEIDGIKRIRALPGVVMAEMSYHNFEEDNEILENIPEDLDDENLEKANVPPYLNE